MKKVFFIVLVCIGITTSQAVAQTSVCTGFHKKYCHMDGSKRDEREFLYNAQSKSGLFAQGTVSKMRCVVYKGMDYRISVCCEAGVGDKVNFKIYDGRTNEQLFDNTKNDDAQQFEFQAGTSRQLVIEATIPAGDVKEEKGKAENAACVGLLIENKVSDKVGFSQY
jgi:hypothetical protein